MFGKNKVYSFVVLVSLSFMTFVSLDLYASSGTQTSRGWDILSPFKSFLGYFNPVGGIDKVIAGQLNTINNLVDNGVKTASKTVDKAVRDGVGVINKTRDQVLAALQAEIAGVPIVVEQAAKRAVNAGTKAFLQWRNIARFGGTGAFVVGSGYSAYILGSMLKVHLMSPAILLPGANTGWWSRLVRSYNHYKKINIIFPDQESKDRCAQVVKNTKHVSKSRKLGRKVTFRNVLLYGPPGTGKTLFARKMADEADMNFIPVTAASLLQGGSAVENLNKLINDAKRSSYATLIFIDEADALFVNRAILNVDTELFRVINHILGLTGDGHSDYMIVAATNMVDVLDEAVGSRFHDCIRIPVPEEKARKELLTLLINKKFFNVRLHNNLFVTQAKKVFSSDKVDEIVHLTKGFSGRDLTGLVESIALKAALGQTGLLTVDHVDSAVRETRQKNKAFKHDNGS